MQSDRYGLEITTRSAKAAAAYREGIDLLLAAWSDADAPLKRAVDEDPGFALGHAAMARFHQIYGRMPAARDCIARARAQAAGATERERSHVEILGATIEGAGAKALQALPGHLERWPRDAMVLALALGAFGLYGFSGRADHDAARVALCERHRESYGEDWWFLTYLGWSYTEAGDLVQGEACTTRGLELRPANGNAAHAMAHWHAERGDLDAGARFVESWLPAYPRAGILFSHLNWHRSLALQARGERDAALSVLLEHIGPGASLGPSLIVLSDSAALLWRAVLSAPVPPERWRELAAYARTAFPGPTVHFAEWHIAMALAGAGETDALEKRLASVREREASGAMPTGGAVEAVCRGLAAFAASDWRGAAAHLERAAPDFIRLGGSTAQRRILHDTLNRAKARAGAHE